LFSYVVFQATSERDEGAVVAGVDFRSGPAGIEVKGDIAGEETGHVYFDGGAPKQVPSVVGEVLAAGREVAAILTAQRPAVARALGCIV
jgi:hypothetical protein